MDEVNVSVRNLSMLKLTFDRRRKVIGQFRALPRWGADVSRAESIHDQRPLSAFPLPDTGSVIVQHVPLLEIP